MGDAWYVESISRYEELSQTTLSLMRLPEPKARRRRDLLQQLFAEGGTGSATYRDLERRFNAISGPTELYDVPPGDYKLGQVITKLPEGSKHFVPQDVAPEEANA